MRLSVHSERQKGSANHADRQFDYIKYAPHIDPTKVKDNIYIGKEDDNISFREQEYEYYKKNFSKAVEAQNRRNENFRHGERNRTMEDVYQSRITRPEEIIIQIGNKHDKYTDAKTFESIIRDYIKKFENIYGKNCHILDAAIHMEETNIHAHIRRVWFVETDEGKKINQTQALAELGYEKPDLDSPEDRFNNAKIPFSAVERRLVSNICRQHGVELEKTRHGNSCRSLKINDFKRKKMEEDIERMSKEIKEKMDQMDLIDRVHSMVQSHDEDGIEDVFATAARNVQKIDELDDKNKELDKKNKELEARCRELESQIPDLSEINRQLTEKLDEERKKRKHIDDMIRKYDYLEEAYERAEAEERDEEEQLEREQAEKKASEDSAKRRKLINDTIEEILN